MVVQSVWVGLVYAVIYRLLEALLPRHSHREDGMSVAGPSWVWILSNIATMSDTSSTACCVGVSLAWRASCGRLFSRFCCGHGVVWWCHFELFGFWRGAWAARCFSDHHCWLCAHSCRHVIYVMTARECLQVDLAAVRFVLRWVQAYLWRANGRGAAHRLGSRSLQHVVVRSRRLHVKLLVSPAFHLMIAWSRSARHVTKRLDGLLLSV